MSHAPSAPDAPRDPAAGAEAARRAEAALVAFDESPAFICVTRGPDHVFEAANPAYRRLVGRPLLGRTAREAFPEFAWQGFVDVLDEVYRSGRPHVGSEVPVTLRDPDTGAEGQIFISYVFQPVLGADGGVSAVITQGLDVTEQVRTRREAEKLALEHAAVLRHIADAVMVTDNEGRLTYANEAADRLHGGAAWRGMGPDAYFLQHQVTTADGAPVRPAELPLARVLAGAGAVPAALLRLRLPSGQVRWVESDAVAMRDDAGAVVGGLLTLRDVTERREAAAATRRSERRYRSLFEHAAVGVAHVSADGRWLEVNGRLLCMLGYAREELVGARVVELSVADDPGAEWGRLMEGVAGGASFEVERHYRRRDGSVLHALVTVSRVGGEEGDPDHFIGIVQDVGEQRRAQEALRESEERFRVLVEHASVGIVSVDADGRFRHANRAYREMLGYSEEELRGLRFSRISHEGERQANLELFGEMLAGKRDSYALEKRYLHRDGHVVWTRLFVAAVRDPDGRFLYTTTLVEDVTEQRLADRARREAEERQRRILETVDDAIWIVSPERRIVFSNRAGEEILGAPVAECSPEALDVSAWRVVGADGEEFAPEARPFVRVLATRRAVMGVECLVDAPNGRRMVLSLNATPLLASDGTVEGVVASVRDVEQARGAAERIRFQAALLGEVGEAVIATDAEGRVVYWNAAAERLYGWTAEEAAGRPVVELTPSEDSHAAAREIMDALLRGESWSGELDVRRKDGSTFPARVTDAPLHDASGALVGIVGVSSDLTERRALEQQLHQSQKMEAVGRLAGGIAHDFNNLLSVILGNLALLMMDLPEGDPLREELREIEQAARRAARLTQQLLAFSRRQILKPEPVDLNDRIRDMEGMMRRVIGEDVEFVTRLDPALGRVRVDPSQLEQVLMNLLVNARDAMPHGGRVTVETCNDEVGDPPPANLGDALEPGPYVRLLVRDTGAGMDADTRARVFEPFFTTKDVGKGTGLGLSTVYGIVRQSGGVVCVDSAPGKGAAFRVYLPRISAPAAVDPEAGHDEFPRGRGTVLLVEDEAAVRSVARRILERGGYTVLEADGGVAALRVGESLDGPIDLLVTDVVMPGVGGTELADALRRLHPGLKVLFMSGYTEDRLVHHGADGERPAFMQKPFRPDDLLRHVRALLEE
ncbi:MAG: domain S-box protein [Gemmatimonadetes bacterium]|nr:domain S-box protein [Gemmatimonadota bacterium]